MKYPANKMWIVGALLACAAPCALAQSIDAKVASMALSSGQRIDGFIVHYKPGMAPNGAAAAQDIYAASSSLMRSSTAMSAIQTNALRTAGFSFKRKTSVGGYVVRASKALDGPSAMALMREAAANPAVESIEPDVRLYPFRDYRLEDVSTGTPNDPNFSYQWHFRAGDGTPETIGRDTQAFANKGGSNAAKAWSLSQGEGVVVAVIDTGATSHPDLDTSLTDQSYDFISDALVSGRATDGRAKGAWDLGDWTTDSKYLASNGGCVDNVAILPEPSSWHGTHVMGNIAELTDNGVGMAGVAGKARVLPIRALGHCGGSTSDIADAIVWAAGGHVDGLDDNAFPAQVINMSLGGEGACSASTDLGKAINTAMSLGATVIVAAGNSAQDASTTSPANCPGVVTVASNGITGKPAFYSNYGANVSLSAPGGGVYPNDASTGTPVAAGFAWSAINAGTTVPEGPTYGSMAGTSQATPEVAGAAALMIAARKKAGLPVLTPNLVKDYLTSTTRGFPQSNGQSYGIGILDTFAAVTKALDPNSSPAQSAIPLVNGVVVRRDVGYNASEIVYKFVVPAKTRVATFRTMGGSGDVSLVVGKDTVPVTTTGPYSSAHVGNNESVTISAPAAGTYYMRVTGIGPTTSFSVVAMTVQ